MKDYQPVKIDKQTEQKLNKPRELLDGLVHIEFITGLFDNGSNFVMNSI